MITVLVVAAEAYELHPIESRSRRVAVASWGLGYSQIVELNEARIVLVANGPGARLAGEAADRARVWEAFDAVVSTGVCGALDPALSVGQVVVASEVNGYKAWVPRSRRPVPVVRAVSIDRVAGTVEEKSRLFEAGAAIVEMEAAAVAGRAEVWHKPFFCVKAVSDGAEESFGIDLNAFRKEDGRFEKRRILGRALRNPFRSLPELVRLNRQSNLAARALGDFFAECSF